MNFRTSNIIGSLVLAFAASISGLQSSYVYAETLKITGPDGEIQSVNRQYGPTTKSDTFWGISQRVRPDRRISIYQVMAAIYDANPHAFATRNYNSLEVGMILLIPPADAMLAIPKNIAKKRAQNNDLNWQQRSAKKEIARTEIKQQKQINAEIKKVEQEPNSQKKIDELLGLLDLEKSQVMSLTDDIGRTQDELRVAQDDLLALKTKLNELNDRIAALDDSLLETRQQNAALKAENKALQEAAALKKIEKPTNIWRSLLDNPLFLIAAAVLPALLLIGLIILFIRRRQNKAEEYAFTSEQKDTVTVEDDISPQDVDLETALGADIELEAVEDNLDELAVYLDDEPEDSEPAVESDDGIVEELIEQDTNLDDLWSEALDEQIEGKEISSDVEDLLNKLDGMGVEDEQVNSQSEILGSENIDEMSVGQNIDDATEKSESADSTLSTDNIDLESMLDTAVSEDTTSSEAEELVDLDDDELLKSFSIDSLDNNDSDAINEEDSIDIDLKDSIDFDLKLEPSVDDNESEATQSAIDTLTEKIDSSIDFDSPLEDNDPKIENADEVVSALTETEQNTESSIEEPSSDNLEADFDSTVDSVEDQEEIEQTGHIAQAAAKELNTEFGEELDELDALMAEFGVSSGTEEQVTTHTEKPVGSVEMLEEPDVKDTIVSENEAMTEVVDIEPSETSDELQSIESTNVDDLNKSESSIQDSITDDELLASFAKIDSEIEQTETMLENDFSFEGDNMTVNEALAVLDDETPEKVEPVPAADSDLSQFQKENGFIDIDKLLNEATESSDDVDQYKEVDVDLGVRDDKDGLLENTTMIDVDDAENTVNAKLDLARAYIEIDDNSSAKALLEEIQIDGNDRQKKEAVNLLESIS